MTQRDRHPSGNDQATTTLPPLGKPMYIQSYMPSSDEIRRKSVLTIEMPDDLNSQKLGTNIYEETCLTCDGPIETCGGHDGCLELPIPIYRIFFVKRLIQLLNCICFYCQRLRIPKEDPKYTWIKNLPLDVRLEYLEQHCKPYKYCGMLPKDIQTEEDTQADLSQTASKDIHGPCHKMFVQFRNEDRDSTFIRAVIRLDNIDYMKHRTNANWKPITIGPQDIFDCLNNIDAEALDMLGCNQHNLPASYMWSVLNIPSLNTRPCHTFAGIGNSKKRIFNDWTKFLRNIVMARNELRDTIKLSSEKVTCCHYIFQDVESRNFALCFRYGYLEKKERDKHKKRLKLDLKKANYGAIEMAWRNLHNHTAAFHSHRHKKFIKKSSYGKPLVNVEERYKFQKYGRFRGNILARRVDNAGRGVLEGDIHIHLDQVCIPRKEAMNISVKTYVTSWNLQRVQKWLLNGPYVYPGANYVMMKNGKEINLGFHENRRDILLSEVLFIRRHLMDGDLVLVGRQPTLHRPSMMTFRCLIIDGYAIRLHYANFPPMGADCDGDEVNFQVIQTVEAMAEAQEISCVKNNIMKDGKICIKFIQNAVIAAYLMTKERVLLDEDEAHYIVSFLGLFGYPEPEVITDDGEPRWTGHQLISMLLPRDFTVVTDKMEIRNGLFLRGELNDKMLNGIDGILHHLYKDYADHEVTMKFIYQAYILFQNYLNLFGHSAGYFDCAIDFHDEDAVAENRANLQLTEMLRQMDKVQDNISKLNRYTDTLPSCVPNAADAVTENNIRDHMDKITHMSSEAVMKYHEYVNRLGGDQNGILHMIKSGAKGSPSTLNQMCGVVSQIYVMYRRYPTTSSHFINGKDSLEAYGFIRQSYSRGLPLTGVIIESPSTCESVVNKNRGTSKAGYSTRKLNICMMGIVIDYLNRAVDTNNRIIWSVYGNDGYDSQCMTPSPLKIMNLSPTEIVMQYGLVGFDESVMLPEIRAEWEQSRHAPECHEMLTDLLTLCQTLRRLLSRCTDNTAMTMTRTPFDFLHLFHRCANTLNTNSTSSPVDLHPLQYIQFTKLFWQRLVQEKLVVAENLSQKILFFDWLSPRILMQWKFGAIHIKWIGSEIMRILARTKVEPGESVGMNATQNIGEPFAQLVLKTPHFSGKFTNVVAGTVRIANIIDVNFCNPLMTIVLKSHITTQTEANIFGLSLARCYLKDILDRYPEFSFRHESGDKLCTIVIPIHKLHTIQRLISLRSVVKIISTMTALPLDVFQVSFMDEPGDWFIRLNISLKSTFWKTTASGLGLRADEKMTAENIIYNLCNSIVIHGIPNVENFVTEEIMILTEAGPEKRWSISTLGSDLRYVLRLPEVDTRRTISNDVTEMCAVFGTHAARKSLENEFLLVMSGMVDSRHIKLVSRMMASDLVIKGLKIKQIGTNLPALQRAAYEQGPKQMLEYCSIAEIDDGKTICGGALMNKPMLIGSYYNLDNFPLPENLYPDIPTNPKPQHISSYVFSPKVQGIRYFMILYRNRRKEKFASLLDSHNTVITLNHEGIADEFFHGTMVEGVLQGRIFFVHDCLMICGNKSSVLRYDQRIELAREVMYRLSDQTSYRQEYEFGTAEEYALPIALRPETSFYLFSIGQMNLQFFVKPIFDISGLQHYVQHWLPRLSCKHNGFMFTNIIDPVYSFNMKPDSLWKYEFNGGSFIFTIRPVSGNEKCPLLHHQFRGKKSWPYSLKMAKVEKYRVLSGGTHVMTIENLAFSHVTMDADASGQYEMYWKNNSWHAIKQTLQPVKSLGQLVNFLQSVEDQIHTTEIVCV